MLKPLKSTLILALVGVGAFNFLGYQTERGNIPATPTICFVSLFTSIPAKLTPKVSNTLAFWGTPKLQVSGLNLSGSPSTISLVFSISKLIFKSLLSSYAWYDSYLFTYLISISVSFS